MNIKVCIQIACFMFKKFYEVVICVAFKLLGQAVEKPTIILLVDCHQDFGDEAGRIWIGFHKRPDLRISHDANI